MKHIVFFLLLYVLNQRDNFAVEGTWTVWGPYGVCTGTCDSTAMHNRTRNYTEGIMPCSGNDTEVTIGCNGEAILQLSCHEIM